MMRTVLLAMKRVSEGVLDLDTTVSTLAWPSRIGGSQVYLAEGETFPLGELLKAVMIASANDAAVSVAEHIAGSTAAFVELMNARAKALGLADTTYQSPLGLPPGKGQTADLTSAHGLAVLARELMRSPEVMRWAGTATAGFRDDTLQMANTNHLIRTYAGATGLKTGYYREAGFSVTASATRNDLSLIAAVLGLPTKQESFAEAARLLNESFATYRVVAPARRGAPVGRCRSRAAARRASRRWRWATSACSSSAARTKAWSSRRTYRVWFRRRSSSASRSATSSSAAVIRSSGACPW